MRRMWMFAGAALLGCAVSMTAIDAKATSGGSSDLLSSNGSVGYSITFLRSSPSTASNLRGRWAAPSVAGSRVRPPTRPPVGAVPEPAAFLAFGAGALLVAASLRRR